MLRYLLEEDKQKTFNDPHSKKSVTPTPDNDAYYKPPNGLTIKRSARGVG